MEEKILYAHESKKLVQPNKSRICSNFAVANQCMVAKWATI